MHLPARFIPAAKNEDPKAVRKILIVKFFGIGSLILATPLFAAARKVFPNAEIHLLTLSGNREITAMIPDIDQVHGIDLGRNIVTAVSAYLGCLLKVFRNRYDVLIDLEFYTRASAVVSLASWAPVRVGFHSQGVYRGDIQSHRVPFNVYWHVRKNFLSLLEPFGHDAGADGSEPSLAFPPGPGDNARKIIDDLGARRERFVVVNVNAGELAYERRWSPDRFARLAARLCNEYGVGCVFVGAPGERDYVQGVVDQVRALGGEAHNAAGRLTLAELAQVCRQSRLVITNDSGPAHIAAATGTPVAAFFGPETPVLYGPVGDHHLVFHKDLSCSPCIHIEYGKRVKCWHETTLCQEGTGVDDAFQAIRGRYGDVLAAPVPAKTCRSASAAPTTRTRITTGSNTTV